ncbi:hypothetical protein BGX21_005694 [Mortierella sp. AD011]|nr:hypothetical protein BGX21_005694 [Mortierella sp. AD011]
MNEGEQTADVSKRFTRKSVMDRARGAGFDHVAAIMEPSYGAAASVPDDSLALFVKAVVGAASLSRDYLRSASICVSALGPFAIDSSSCRVSVTVSRRPDLRRELDWPPTRVSGLGDYTCVEQGLVCQQLELLGDAVLDILAIEHWIDTRPQNKLVELSRADVASTNRGVLAVEAIHIHLDEAIHYRCADTKLEMAKFRADLEAKESAIQVTRDLLFVVFSPSKSQRRGSK